MSYARWGADSAVYVYADFYGGVVCCGCSLSVALVENTYTDVFGVRHEQGEPNTFGDTIRFYAVSDLIEHLRMHVEAGEPVPSHLLDPATYNEEDFERRRPGQ